MPGNLGQCANLLSSVFAVATGAFHAVAFDTNTPGRARVEVRAPDGSPLELTLTDPTAQGETRSDREAWTFALFLPRERVAEMVRLLESNGIEVYSAWQVRATPSSEPEQTGATPPPTGPEPYHRPGRATCWGKAGGHSADIRADRS
ncbi:hypothetical protein [Microbispora amethystogenes]|uniref:hypothetical protein n=1 Tax=Microbispora amethystogenes TaxID=1427754 RepID=UPI001953D1E2|nr:hypothetical protein [Microbispora amethystogenes]